jgi:hypothetical protein
VFKGASFFIWLASFVVLLATKRGKAGKLKASVSTSVSIDQINRRHDLQTNYGQGLNGIYSPTAANSWEIK